MAVIPFKSTSLLCLSVIYVVLIYGVSLQFRFIPLMLWEVYDRMISMYSLTPEERYLEIINRCPDLLKLITLKELASYLLIRPETLSRIRRKVVQK